LSLFDNLNIYLQPKQLEAFYHLEYSDCQYLLYGGAKSGGKSFLVRAKEFIRRMNYSETMGIIIRRTYDELYANHILKFLTEEPWARYCTAWYREGKKAIYYPNGSITFFKYLDKGTDVFNFQGIEYDDISIDEATQHEEIVFTILKTSLRKDPKKLAKNPTYKPKMLLTANPGGIGHFWCQRRFIKREFMPNENPVDFHFIPAKIQDNPIFLKANPQYLKNLNDLPEDLRKAYKDGDWNVFAGQYFRKLREDKHLIEPFYLNPDWFRFRSLDWGYDHNTVCLWWCVDYDGNIYIYRGYKRNAESPTRMAGNIIDLTPTSENVILTVASHDCWERTRTDDFNPATTMADLIKQRGLYIEKAVNTRITGWQVLGEYLDWDEAYKPTPRLKIFNTCRWVFDDLQKLIHDENSPEDVKKMNGDDTGDAARYGGMYVFSGVKPIVPKNEEEEYVESLIKDYSQTELAPWGADI